MIMKFIIMQIMGAEGLSVVNSIQSYNSEELIFVFHLVLVSDW